MPLPHPEYLRAQRLFARALAFDLECPYCGLVYRIRATTNPRTYNPRTAIFYCNGKAGCRRSYVIGLLVWPKGRGAGAGTPPTDQVPGPRQLAQLRQEAGAWWMTDEYKHKGRPDPTNLTGEDDRLAPENPYDVDLATTEPREHPRCLRCFAEYNPLKSQAKEPSKYCSMTCEGEETP
jgi:hypothetical protein